MIDNGGIILGGVGASAWSFMLLLSALSTVHNGRQPSVWLQRYAGVAVNAALVAFTIPFMIKCHEVFLDITRFSEYWPYWKVYDFVRLLLLALSALIMFRLYYVMRQTSIPSERTRSPLYHLLHRILPYPIILAVSRLGGTTYKQVYGEGISRITESARGWQVFWAYVFVLLMPLCGAGCLLAFVNVTAGAGRSLIQMLHLECIFTLPDAPVAWATQGLEGGRESKYKDFIPSASASASASASGLEVQRSTMSRNLFWAHNHQQQQNVQAGAVGNASPALTLQEALDRINDMDEHDLAVEFTYSIYNNDDAGAGHVAGGAAMSNNEDDNNGNWDRDNGL